MGNTTPKDMPPRSGTDLADVECKHLSNEATGGCFETAQGKMLTGRDAVEGERDTVRACRKYGNMDAVFSIVVLG